MALEPDRSCLMMYVVLDQRLILAVVRTMAGAHTTVVTTRTCPLRATKSRSHLRLHMLIESRRHLLVVRLNPTLKCDILSYRYWQHCMSCVMSHCCSTCTIFDFRGPVMGSLKSPCKTSYRSSMDTVALYCLVFWENRVYSILLTDRQTHEQMDSTDALSRSRCCERRLNNVQLLSLAAVQCIRVKMTD